MPVLSDVAGSANRRFNNAFIWSVQFHTLLSESAYRTSVSILCIRANAPVILYCLKNTTAWIFTDHLGRSSFLLEEVEEVVPHSQRLLLAAPDAALAVVQDIVLPVLH